MRLPIKLTMLAALALLGGCAGLIQQAPTLGDPVAVVEQKMGRPSARYRVGSGQVFEYATGPMGQQTFMAHFTPDGRLLSYEQVLTSEKFATVRIDAATKNDILLAFGRPAEVSRVAMHDYEVWSYRYKEAGVWNSLMHVHFDRQGVVRHMMNGPDPQYEPRDRQGP
ncbi:hypothetical protein [Massilia sp. H6]|uniref:hypothetical protein n=1 Tax=Massilia sp. H6 TaxID=2970464 RepID=UPI002167A710|nr:hypothetical protein [Massilia sp. H6]UVW27591.1 hypothetical protein NRS07_13670 [Massilia sp. H6]